MYRVRLASGEETAFRSVAELALGIQSGVITGDAEVYHAPEQQWRPISAHPEYLAAAEQVSRMAGPATGAPALPVPDAEVEVLLEGKVPIYKMVSVSARELEARRRPPWIAKATTGGAAFIFLIAVVLASSLGGGGSDVAWSRPRVASRTELPQAARTQSGSSGTLQAWQSGPAALANRAATARAEVARLLGESASALGVHRLMSPPRLTSPDSLRAVRQAVASFRPAVTRWRDAETDVIAAYRDSAAALARAGKWDRSELTEWRVRAPRNEAIATARTTDSLLLVLDRAYVLLQQSDQIDSAGHPSFSQTNAATEYDWLRATVARFVAVPVLPGERLPPPLVILLGAIGGTALPARAVR
ncbi:MAG: hypothetical protein SGJ01_02185 [Gemmatimonadota bacterium]|nr:hypothetical protein [Gemmatimonadota bacterium]